MNSELEELSRRKMLTSNSSSQDYTNPDNHNVITYDKFCCTQENVNFVKRRLVKEKLLEYSQANYK